MTFPSKKNPFTSNDVCDEYGRISHGVRAMTDFCYIEHDRTGRTRDKLPQNVFFYV